jgi:hypothetical protein
MTKPDLTDDDYSDLAKLVREAIDAEPVVSEAEGRPAPRLAECRSQPEILKIAYTPATGALNGSTMTAGARWRTPYRPAPRCI